MKNKFIYSPKKSLFEKKLAAGEIGEGSVVFIEDTKEIWNRGHYFGLVGSGSGIDPEILSGIETAIATLQSDKADKSELSDYALKSELPSLDGYLTKTVADGLYATIAQYNALNQTVGDIQTELSNKLTSTDLEGYAKTADVPTKISDLTDDSDFITNAEATAAYAPKSLVETVSNQATTISTLATKNELSTGLAGKLDNAAADGFVPTTRKVNGKALDQDITITATDPNAATKEELSDVNTDLQTFKNNVALTYATDQDVADAVAALVDSSPEALDTLNELAAALGDDPNFATTVATNIGKKADQTALDQTNTNVANIAESLSSYLPLSGGTIAYEGDSGLRLSSTNLYSNYLWFEGIVNGSKLNLGALGMRGYNNPAYVSPTGFVYGILHEDNYSNLIGDYYLKSSGGTIKGPFGSLIIERNDDVDGFSGICFTNKYGTLGYLGVGGGKSDFGKQPSFFDGSNTYTLIHSGNIGEYAIKKNIGIDFQSGLNEAGYGYKAAGWKKNGPALMVGANQNYRMALQSTVIDLGGGKYMPELCFNYSNSGEWIGWKYIAFTDSDITGNAGSATKLQTARTIWGQSFDGTRNIEITTSGLMRSLGFTGTDNATQVGYVGRGSNSNNDIVLAASTTNGNVRILAGGNSDKSIYLNSSGNVTIGDSDLAGSYQFHKLCIDGVLAMPKDVTRTVCAVLGFSEDDLYLGYSNTNTYNTIIGGKNVILNPNGNVLIGTTTDNGAKLQVEGKVFVNRYEAENLSGGADIVLNKAGNYYVGIGSASSDKTSFAIGRLSTITDAWVSEDIVISDNGYVKVDCPLIISGAVTMSSTLSVGGNTAITGTCSASSGFFETSDERLKDFTKDIDVDFEKLKSIPKKYFTWKNDEEKVLQLGTSAQAVQEVFPELVSGKDPLSVNYSKLVIPALAAIDKLYEENQVLKDRLTCLENKLNG